MGTTCALRDGLQSARAIHAFAAQQARGPGQPVGWWDWRYRARQAGGRFAMRRRTLPRPFFTVPGHVSRRQETVGAGTFGVGDWPNRVLTKADDEGSSRSRENPDVGESEPRALPVGCATGQPLWRGTWKSLNRLNSHSTSDSAVPVLGRYPRDAKTGVQTKTCTGCPRRHYLQ